MQYLFQGRIALVWLGLTFVMLISWQISGGGHNDWHPSLFVSMTVIVIAVIKARFVLREFMEVGHASRWLRVLTDVWVLALPATILGALLI